MNSTQIEYFLTLCKYKNYSETARRLFVSQPTISKQISALEAELGVQLFTRSTKKLQLTMEGAVMKTAFSQMMDIVSTATMEARQLNQNLADSIKVGILEGSEIVSFLLEPLLDLFLLMEKYAMIQVEFMTHKEINEALHNNTIDVAITMSQEAMHHSDLKYTRLRSVTMGVMAHRSLNLILSGDIDMNRINDYPFFIYSDGSYAYKVITNQLQDQLHIKQEQFVTVPNIDTMLLNVELGQGIAMGTNSPRIAKNDALDFYPFDDKQMIVAAWNLENQNPSRNRFVKQIRKKIIQTGYF